MGSIKARVLIVDDALFMRTRIKSFLEDSGYLVVAEASNGEEAIELYEQLNPDVVTMDITMPVMNGIEAVKKIMEDYPEAKIVMCSAMGQDNKVLAAIKAGAIRFVVKPFEKDILIKTIDKLLEID